MSQSIAVANHPKSRWSGRRVISVTWIALRARLASTALTPVAVPWLVGVVLTHPTFTATCLAIAHRPVSMPYNACAGRWPNSFAHANSSKVTGWKINSSAVFNLSKRSSESWRPITIPESPVIPNVQCFSPPVRFRSPRQNGIRSWIACRRNDGAS